MERGDDVVVQQLSPGMRIELRDAEWRIDRVDIPTFGGRLLTCTAASELVRGRTGKFLTDLESDTRVLSPETTHLQDDLSSGYVASQLYIDAQMQATAPADALVHRGHQAAMDVLPYQLDPALQALKQTRPRILIADSVGLGKTIGAGILMTELIRRHRGKRILVLAVKSMLAQLQRELWQRFTIPLVRLDSVGLQRVRNTIPTNHNPFHYIDRSIISIDTLKQSREFRHYLEQCHWDIIVIDEAHNVAQRSSNSQRHKLAQMLCTRCDAMLMLSATPHDGKPESFASLIHMLDPTAIPDVKDYSREDYKNRGLVVRRFKHDIADQLRQALPERTVHKPVAVATPAELHAYQLLREATFVTLNRKSKRAKTAVNAKDATHATFTAGGQLFRTTLEKALLSSPAACLSTIRHRIARLQSLVNAASSTAGHNTANDATTASAITRDINTLESLHTAIAAIGLEQFSKFQYLVAMLGGKAVVAGAAPRDVSIGWDRKASDDRIVIFTESVVTLEYLYEHLPPALELKTAGAKTQVAMLHGSMKDTDIVETVNAFNRSSDSLRLLLCSDVASEGLNLHHCSHRLIHFDIPWSLMVFQQRNGRVDRYGQAHAPQIHYLTVRHDQVRNDSPRSDLGNSKGSSNGSGKGNSSATTATTDTIASAHLGADIPIGDNRVLDILIEKDSAASHNLGDPSEFGSREEQEALTAAAIEHGPEAFDLMSLFDQMKNSALGDLGAFESDTQPTRHTDLPSVTQNDTTVFTSAHAFLRTGLGWLAETDKPVTWEEDGDTLVINAPADLQALSRRQLPREARPDDFRFRLTPDKQQIMDDMQQARDDADASFGNLHYLWPQHPVLGWMRQRVLDGFGRHTAPVLRLPQQLQPDEHWFLLQGGFPNRRGQALIQDQLAAQCVASEVRELLPLHDCLQQLGINGTKLPNRADNSDCSGLMALLPVVVGHTRTHLQHLRDSRTEELQQQAQAELATLCALREQHLQQLELALAASAAAAGRKQRQRESRTREVERHFADYERWLRDSVQTEAEPYIQVIAVLTGSHGELLR